MGKILKRASAGDEAEIVLYERSTLEEGAVEAGDAPEASVLDPVALREKIIADAISEGRALAEAKVQEAYAEGLRRGMEAARRDFEERVAVAADALDAASAAMRESHETFLATLEPEVFELVRRITEQVIGRELRTDPELLVETIRRALHCLADEAEAKVRLAPGDIEVLQERQVDVIEQLKSVHPLVIIPDGRVEPGGCVVDTERVRVDAQPSHMFERILQHLAD